MRTSHERWSSEQAFFDDQEYRGDPIQASTIERYAVCARPYLAAEYRFRAMGDLRGKRVLELGCGSGITSVLLALNGAEEVVGIDISPRAVAAAQELARKHGVSERVTFHALPLESYVRQATGCFDVIYGCGILHHVVPVLNAVLGGLKRLAHERTTFVFSEPVSLSPWLCRVRAVLPATPCTPDECPLGIGELEILRRHLPNVDFRAFELLARIWLRFIPGYYEDYSMRKRSIYLALCWLDWVVLSLPGFRRLASRAVFVHCNF